MTESLGWFPLYVDRWFGSVAVRGMRPEQRSGYLDLLCWQWQSRERKSIPGSPETLASLSGLDGRWAEMGPRIMENFSELPDGRFRNERLAAIWDEQHGKYARRSAANTLNRAKRAPSAEQCSTIRQPFVNHSSANRGENENENENENYNESETTSRPSPPGHLEAPGTAVRPQGGGPEAPELVLQGEVRKTRMTAEDFRDWWNRLAAAHKLRRCDLMTPRKLGRFRSAVGLGILDRLPELAKAIGESPHLLGVNDRGWKADIEFVLREWVAILERKYEFGNSPGKPRYVSPLTAIRDAEVAALAAKGGEA